MLYRVLFIDLEKTAAKLLASSDKLSDFQEDYDVQLDLGQEGTDQIHYCLTGEVIFKPQNSTANNSDTNPGKKDGIEDKILKFDATNGLLTGGDSCRYCVESCPEN